VPRREAASRLRIVVLGYVVRGALAGHAWHHLHYAAGLARLGHDVWFVEESDDFPSCYDPVKNIVSFDPGYGLAFAAEAFQIIGLGERWAYHDAHSSTWFGPAGRVALDVCASADIVLNLSGANILRDWLASVPTRVFIDTDPGFTQAEHLKDETAREHTARHTAFFTFGENVNTTAKLPVDGFAWMATRQPIVLDLWPVAEGPKSGAFTTVMLWDSYRTVEVGGVRLGMKSQSMQPYLDLPARVQQPLELALGGSTAPRKKLMERGWRVIDSRVPTRSLGSYRDYIIASRGEFSVAKHGYVITHSGWFSERSANYLATGRPVITQDTGFSDVLPAGEGIVAFSTPDDAAAGITDVATNYKRHCLAARDLAAAFFDSAAVLSRLLELSFASPASMNE
jgi:hypothetical protein